MNIVWLTLGFVFLTLGIVHLANAKKSQDPAAAKNKLPATLYFVAATLFFAAGAVSLFGPGE